MRKPKHQVNGKNDFDIENFEIKPPNKPPSLFSMLHKWLIFAVSVTFIVLLIAFLVSYQRNDYSCLIFTWDQVKLVWYNIKQFIIDLRH